MIRDITEQVIAEQARGEFVAHVAHELKTPLNTLKSYSEMLMDGEAGDEETKREFYNTINEEADRLSGLIGNLLNITKIEMGSLQIQKTRVKTEELLEELAMTAERQKKGKDLAIHAVFPDKLPVIKADKELLKTALLNLLSNSIKYTDEGKGITFKAEQDDDVIMIHVIDSGIGIPPEDLPHIFDKFYRSQDKKVRQRPGHGLGLSLARQIVELHDGELRVISHPGEGSQFTVILKKGEDLLE
jgi:two-component system sensor histidine kinase VicK